MPAAGSGGTVPGIPEVVGTAVIPAAGKGALPATLKLWPAELAALMGLGVPEPALAALLPAMAAGERMLLGPALSGAHAPRPMLTTTHVPIPVRDIIFVPRTRFPRGSGRS
jgi:hypothetical protein